MQFSYTATDALTTVASDALAVGVFEDGAFSPEVVALDAALNGAILDLRARREFRGKVGETSRVLTLGHLPSARIIIVGLGMRDGFTPETARRAAGALGKLLERTGIERASVQVFQSVTVAQEEVARAMVEGFLLRAYRFDGYFSEERPVSHLESLELLTSGDADITSAIALGEAMARGANFARDLANEPPNVLYPAELARRAEALAAASGLEVEVFELEDLKRHEMGALLAVGQGSAREPRLIVLRYLSNEGRNKPTLGIIGKGITFDTGGISLKPGADMHLMKTDMGGAAAMIGAMHAIATLRPALNVTMIVASAENMPDGTAFRPGDILRAKNGKTIEIQNTDAEGRLVLADALSYAVELALSPIIDAATLTGACSVALGPFYSACFSNDDSTRTALLGAAGSAGERLWPMPLDPDFRPLLDSSCADLRNVGGREGGAITAAMFLQEFVSAQPWAHLDIAPTAFADSETAYFAKGLATGHPARTIVQLALDLAAAGS